MLCNLLLFAFPHVIFQWTLFNCNSASKILQHALYTHQQKKKCCECHKTLRKELRTNFFNTVTKSFHVHSSVTPCTRAASAAQGTLLTAPMPRGGAEVSFGTLGFVGLSACLFLDDLINFKNYTRNTHMNTAVTTSQKSALLPSSWLIQKIWFRRIVLEARHLSRNLPICWFNSTVTGVVTHRYPDRSQLAQMAPSTYFFLIP